MLNAISFAASPPVLQKSALSTFSGVRLRCPLSNSNSVSVSVSAKSRSVVMMAKKEEELKEIRAKSTEQINEEIIDLKGDLLMLRLQKSNRNEFKASEFRRMRKRVARMLTVRREREVEEGISKRISRKLDRKWKKSIIVRPPPSLQRIREEAEAQNKDKESA